MELQIVDGDLLDQDVEVIVNAWNRNIIPWWLLLPKRLRAAALQFKAPFAPQPADETPGDLPVVADSWCHARSGG